MGMDRVRIKAEKRAGIGRGAIITLRAESERAAPIVTYIVSQPPAY